MGENLRFRVTPGSEWGHLQVTSEQAKRDKEFLAEVPHERTRQIQAQTLAL